MASTQGRYKWDLSKVTGNFTGPPQVIYWGNIASVEHQTNNYRNDTKEIDMSKFKVGDLVTPSKPEVYLTYGKAYEVTYSNGYFSVEDDTGEDLCCLFENDGHGGQWTHYGQTLAELNVKAGDVVECVYGDYSGNKYTVENGRHNGEVNGSDTNPTVRLGPSKPLCMLPTSKYNLFIISRATPQPNWLPCPADYKPQDNHEVTYHMGVPTHYYVTEPVLVDVELKAYVCKAGGIDGWHINTGYRDDTNATLRGKTKDGKPVGQWVIDMDDDQ